MKRKRRLNSVLACALTSSILFLSLFCGAWAIHPAKAAPNTQSSDIVITHVEDKAVGLDAKIIVIQPQGNRDFAFVDVPSKVEGDNIRDHWRAEYALMINGGYFNEDFSPAGFCRIDGRVIGEKQSKKLSGYVVLDDAGAMSLLTRDDDISRYPDVIQTGPYVIDPGGNIGIRSNDGKSAERTLIGKTKDDRLLIIVTNPITLFDLAVSIKAKMPEIERLLNLDGGPSTAMKTAHEEVLNRWPVRNYIVKQKDVSQASEVTSPTKPKPQR